MSDQKILASHHREKLILSSQLSTQIKRNQSSRFPESGCFALATRSGLKDDSLLVSEAITNTLAGVFCLRDKSVLSRRQNTLRFNHVRDQGISWRTASYRPFELSY